MPSKKLIQFNEDFKSSINIEYDYDNTEKINNYILTHSNINGLKFFVHNLKSNKNRANFLIGAYGKGKSNLLLVLLNILTSYNSDSNKNVNKFIEKIKRYDAELYNDLIAYRKNNDRLLPIIINSNYKNLQTSFLLSIRDAIEKFGFKDIRFQSYYDVAYNTIEKWEKQNSNATKLLKKCLETYRTNIKDIKDGLRSYDEYYYKLFLDIYNCVTNGEDFNPLVNTDVIKIYKEVLHYIKEQNKDYKGIYIVFDEFSKFLEQSSNENIIKDIKFLQDLAEISSRSTNEEQIHFTCITHKPIIEYVKDFGEKRINDFKTIEGRFVNYYLNSDFDESYELISNSFSFVRDEDKQELLADKQLVGIYNYCKNSVIFKNCIDFDKVIKNNCFPINPIVLYSLISINDYIGQNERSIFNFITQDDKMSFKFFIEKKLYVNYKLYSLDLLYEYYENLLKNNFTEDIKEIYDKTLSSIISINALEKITDEIRICASRIVKALSIIHLCKQIDYLTPSRKNLKIALNIIDNDSKQTRLFDEASQILIDNGIIEEISLNESFKFTDKITSLLKQKAKQVASKNQNFNIDYFLNANIDETYELPRKFNDEKCITRFFKYVYITKETLLGINSFDIYFDDQYKDGIIFKIILLNKNDRNTVLEKIESIKDKRIVFMLPNKVLKKELFDLCIMNNSYNAISKDKTISEEQVTILKKESVAIKDIITSELLYYFSEKFDVFYKGELQKGSINSVVSIVCSKLYSKTPAYNYELVNKNIISSTIQKSTEIVCDYIIKNGMSNKNMDNDRITSPENSIYRSFKYSIDISDIDNNEITEDIIDDYLKECEKEKNSIQVLISNLNKKGIYIRNGAFPLYLARAFSKYNGNLVFYYADKEISFEPANMFKMINEPDKYYIAVVKNTSKSNEYLKGLTKIFNFKLNGYISTDVIGLAKNMKEYFYSLPSITRSVSFNNNIVELPEPYISFKQIVLKDNINCYGLIFEDIPNVFGCKIGNKNLIKNISNMKSQYDKYYSLCMKEFIKSTKETLNFSLKNNLKSSFDGFVSNNKDKISSNIYKNKTNDFINFILNNKSYNDEYVLNGISNIYLGNDIANYKGSEFSRLINELSNSFEEIKQSRDKNGNKEVLRITIGTNTIEKGIKKEISAIGNTLKNVLSDEIEEYGSSIDNEEKAYILVQLIEDIVK